MLLKVGAAAFTDQRQRHLRICGELAISGSIRWFDEVPEDDLPLFYNLANVFVFPSLFEGFGFPMLEALGCGTPVVALRAASLPEIAGDAAYWCDPGDIEGVAHQCLLALVHGTSHQRRQARIDRAAMFTWGETVSDTLRVYGRAAVIASFTNTSNSTCSSESVT